MSKIRLELTTEDLVTLISDAVRRQLFSRKNTIARVVVGAVHPRTIDGPCACMACQRHGETLRPLTADELANAANDIARNAANGLFLFALDEFADDRTEESSFVSFSVADLEEAPASADSFDRLCAEAVAELEGDR